MSSGYGGRGPDVVWGVQPQIGSGSIPKKFALVAGLAYVVGGVIGFFFTGFTNFTENTGVSLFGIFHLTPFHNIVHLGVGALWLLAAFTLTNAATEGLNLAIGGVYVLAAVLGFLGYLTFLGVMPRYDADFFLHLITGVVTLLFAGIIPWPDNSRHAY